MKPSKKPKVGFKESFEYLLDVLCFAYYVKADNLVDDVVFDQLEKLYCILFNKETAPNRASERGVNYSRGVEVVYEEIKRRANEKKT